MYVSITDTSSEAQRCDDPQRAITGADLPDDADLIEQAVLRAFDLPIRSLRTPERGRANIAFARQVAIYMAHVHMGRTLTAAARMFGRDRTTAAHACRTVEDRRDIRAIDLKLDAIERALDCWNFSSIRRRTARREKLQ